MFWPKEVWGRHARSLEDFKAPQNADAAVACLNELVTDALRWDLPQYKSYLLCPACQHSSCLIVHGQTCLC